MSKTPTSTLKMKPLLALFLFIAISCSPVKKESTVDPIPVDAPFIYILGTAQDAGFPQAGKVEEWNQVKSGEREIGHVVSLGLIDPVSKKRWLFEATPDFNFQLNSMDDISSTDTYPYDGIFITHGHIGHYTGLMQVGHEVMGAKDVPVYATPRMKNFFETNGPWSQLVNYNNIQLRDLVADQAVQLTNNISVTPIIVPHRDEYTEALGFIINVNQKKALFIPDIDKWEKWGTDIRMLIQEMEYAFLDASFYDDQEMEGRDMSAIPHPFVDESMALFNDLSAEDKAKVIFIHFNHTNPLLLPNSPEHATVIKNGFKVAMEGQVFPF